jgi:hypothetical protein
MARSTTPTDRGVAEPTRMTSHPKSRKRPGGDAPQGRTSQHHSGLVPAGKSQGVQARNRLREIPPAHRFLVRLADRSETRRTPRRRQFRRRPVSSGSLEPTSDSGGVNPARSAAGRPSSRAAPRWPGKPPASHRKHPATPATVATPPPTDLPKEHQKSKEAPGRRSRRPTTTPTPTQEHHPSSPGPTHAPAHQTSRSWRYRPILPPTQQREATPTTQRPDQWRPKTPSPAPALRTLERAAG